MNFIEKIKTRAKKLNKKIVLAEGEELRVIEAAHLTLKENIARIILVGEKEKIEGKAKENGFDVSKAEIVDQRNFADIEKLINNLCELKKNKGMTFAKAEELLKNPLYFGIMLVKNDIADGMVAGCINSTADVLIPTFRILGTKEGIKTASSFFIMEVSNKSMGENGILLFADCGVNPNPSEDQLAEIGILSNNSFKEFVEKDARIAFLSYSTKGSAKGEHVDKVRNAAEIAKRLAPDLKIEGELQLDSAIVPKVSNLKSPDSEIGGRANVLIFPNLDSGNIGYKLVERLGNANAYGPIMQGISKPVNDLSRGCKAEDIAGVIAITAIQAD